MGDIWSWFGVVMFLVASIFLIRDHLKARRERKLVLQANKKLVKDLEDELGRS